MGFMRILGNIIWIIFGGLFTALAWFLIGLLFCITIIGIPVGLQCLKCAKLTLAPFGKDVELHLEKHPIGNVLWAIFLGWGFAFSYAIAGLATCITIIGIPIGLQAFKIAKLGLLPFGSEIKTIK